MTLSDRLCATAITVVSVVVLSLLPNWAWVLPAAATLVLIWLP